MNFQQPDLLSSSDTRPQAGHGARRLRDDRREGREALPHDDDQEPPLDQGSAQEAEHRAQVLHGKVSNRPLAFPTHTAPGVGAREGRVEGRRAGLAIRRSQGRSLGKTGVT